MIGRLAKACPPRVALAFALACGMATMVAAPAPAAERALRLTAAGEPYVLSVMSYREIPFRTVLRQQFDYSCGSAALATLLRFHYGRNTDEAEVFKAMYAQGDQPAIRKVGFSLLDMKRYLEKAGYAADGYRLSYDDLIRGGGPAIAVISVGSYRHFVVIKGAREREVLIGDPALGLKTYTRADFEKVWNGVVLVVHDAPGKHGRFNAPDEWRPWAQAPLGRAMDADRLGAVTRELAPLYQVTQLRR